MLGILHSPIKTLSTIIGGNRLATTLSEPATAQATANWVRAYRDAIVAPHVGSNKAVREAASKLANLITEQSGGNARELATRLEYAGALSALESPPTGRPN